MTGYMGDFPTSFANVVIPFDTFAAATGAPTATTNFANTDVQIYKDGGTTQRSSASGITVSTSFDSNTGLQLIVIDLSDNTDAGFYAAGHEYTVAVADITADGQTLRFWAGSFSIERAGGVLALIKGNAIKVDVNTIKTQTVTCAAGVTVAAVLGTTIAPTFTSALMKVDVTDWAATAVSTPATAGIPEVNVKNINNVSAAAVTTVKAVQGLAVDGVVTTVTNQLTAAAIATGIWQDTTGADFTTASSIGKSLYTTGNAPGAASGIALVGSNMGTVSSVTGAVGSVTAGVSVGSGGIQSTSFAAASIDAAAIATDAIGSAELAATAVTKIAAGVFAFAFPAAYGSYTCQQILELIVASQAGKTSGAATTTFTIRNLADSADVIVATVDASGDRSAVTLTP